jgi:CheY-like chemotaxis protein
VSLPHLLLVDDSEAVLAFSRAALSGHYLVSTATNGREALEKIPRERPDGILLDLSMPEMDGDEVLAVLQGDPALRDIPVVIVSSETKRAEACLAKGAKAFLPKPIKGPELLALTARVLEQHARARKTNGLAALFLVAGPHELAVPLSCVRHVLHELTTQPLPVGPPWLSELIVLHGEPLCVLDLAGRLGVEHTTRVEERMLVVVEVLDQRLALRVDSVRDPEELSAGEVTRSEALGGAQHEPLRQALLGIARTARGPVPVIDPAALVAPALLDELARVLRARGAA